MGEGEKPRRKMSRGTMRVLVFVGLSVVAIGAVMAFTFNRQTVRALRGFDPFYLLVLLAIWVTSFGTDAVSFLFYTRGTDERLGVVASIKAAAFRVFFNLITPFGLGGQPFVVYYLQREGVPAGKGSSIVLMKLIIISLYVFFGAIAGFAYFRTHVTDPTLLNVLFLISGVLQLAFISLIVLGLLRPRAVIRVLSSLGKLAARFGFVKSMGRFRRALYHEAYLAKASFERYFSHRLLPFIGGTVVIGITYAVEVATLWFIFLGLGFRLPFTTAIALGSLFLFLLPILPTPGAAGLGEAAFVVLFSTEVPYYLLGVAVLLWRFFYNYLTSIVGAVLSSRHFSRVIVKQR